MEKRNALRAGAVTATATLMMLMSSPAMAVTRDDGDQPGDTLSTVQTVGLFVLLPIALFVVIGALAALPYGKGKTAK